MINLECTLISTEVIKDSIGNEIEKRIELKVPIIKVEDVYASEFYSASTVGLKPTLKLLISALNYNNQRLLKYMNDEYIIIRVDIPTIDEISLICERKIGNEC